MPDDIPKLPRHRGKKNQPKNSGWQQQRLPALRPFPTAVTTAPIFFCLGSVLVAVGVVLLCAANEALETTVEYTRCTLANGSKAEDLLRPTRQDPLRCQIQFQIDRDYSGDVNFYYGLSKFYQNNRLYFNSRNDQQLFGQIQEVSECDPLDYVHFENKSKIPIAPCGFIANSMFNDTFQLFKNEGNNLIRVPFTTRDVMRERQTSRKFKNPKLEANQSLCEAFQNTTKPPSWRIPICQLGTEIGDDIGPEFTGVGFENVDFMVWMTASALPNFRKMYRKLDRQLDGFTDGLPAGNYTLKVLYNYPVDSFDGNKYFVVTRESWTGERNFFLPILYFVVGGIMLVVSVLLVLLWLRNKILNRVQPSGM